MITFYPNYVDYDGLGQPIIYHVILGHGESWIFDTLPVIDDFVPMFNGYADKDKVFPDFMIVTQGVVGNSDEKRVNRLTFRYDIQFVPKKKYWFHMLVYDKQFIKKQYPFFVKVQVYGKPFKLESDSEK